MNKPIYCRFNMDTACVELLLPDATLISIDTNAVETEFAHNMYHRSELDWLIYNRPLEYAKLVLRGNLQAYIHGLPEHKLNS